MAYYRGGGQKAPLFRGSVSSAWAVKIPARTKVFRLRTLVKTRCLPARTRALPLLYQIKRCTNPRI